MRVTLILSLAPALFIPISVHMGLRALRDLQTAHKYGRAAIIQSVKFALLREFLRLLTLLCLLARGIVLITYYGYIDPNRTPSPVTPMVNAFITTAGLAIGVMSWIDCHGRYIIRRMLDDETRRT